MTTSAPLPSSSAQNTPASNSESPARGSTICSIHNLPERYRCTAESLWLCQTCAKDHQCNNAMDTAILPIKRAIHLQESSPKHKVEEESRKKPVDTSLDKKDTLQVPKSLPRKNHTPPCPIHNLPQKFRCTLEALPLCLECSKTHVCEGAFRGLESLAEEARMYKRNPLSIDTDSSSVSGGSSPASSRGSTTSFKSTPSLPRPSKTAARPLFDNDSK